MIGIDWGTSSFRAYRLAADGSLLDRLASADGIQSVALAAALPADPAVDGDPRFPALLRRRIGDWLAMDPGPVLISGMAGSRQGWVETPYLDSPCGLDDLAAALVPVRAGDRLCHLVPGVRQPGEPPDVMRGEETQLFGLVAAGDGADGLAVLPGTHSKWAVLADGRIGAFATYLTGELFDVLCRHSVLGRTMAGDDIDPQGFAAGVDQALAGRDAPPGTLLTDLFGVRARLLAGGLTPAAQRGFLSGLLIGSEVAAAVTRFPQRPIVIIGAARLATLYRTALALDGHDAEPADSDIVARGLFALARRAGLIGEPPAGDRPAGQSPAGHDQTGEGRDPAAAGQIPSGKE